MTKDEELWFSVKLFEHVLYNNENYKCYTVSHNLWIVQWMFYLIFDHDWSRYFWSRDSVYYTFPIIYILIHLLIIQQTTIFPGNIIISSDIYREDKLISYARIKETYKPTFITKILRSKFTSPSNPRLPTNNRSIIQLFNIDLHHQIINRKIQPSQPEPFPISKDTLFT